MVKIDTEKASITELRTVALRCIATLHDEGERETRRAEIMAADRNFLAGYVMVAQRTDREWARLRMTPEQAHQDEIAEALELAREQLEAEEEARDAS